MLKFFKCKDGVYRRCYAEPLKLEDANKWLKRIGAVNFEFVQDNEDEKAYELKYFDRALIHEESDSVLAICKKAVEELELDCDWFNSDDNKVYVTLDEILR